MSERQGYNPDRFNQEMGEIRKLEEEIKQESARFTKILTEKSQTITQADQSRLDYIDGQQAILMQQVKSYASSHDPESRQKKIDLLGKVKNMLILKLELLEK